MTPLTETRCDRWLTYETNDERTAPPKGQIPFAVYALGSRDLPYQIRHLSPAKQEAIHDFIHIHYLQVVLFFQQRSFSGVVFIGTQIEAEEKDRSKAYAQALEVDWQRQTL